MQRLYGVPLLLAILAGACGGITPDVDFCQVLAAAPKYAGRTFRAEIIVVPDYHGWVATMSACKARRVIKLEYNSAGSPMLQKLSKKSEEAFHLRESSPVWKGAAARVRARVEQVSPTEGYVLRLLDADDIRLVDLPKWLYQP